MLFRSDEDLTNEFLRGGRALSDNVGNEMAILLWRFTYYLQLTRNTLKNKPWKQSGVLTDEGRYEHFMKKATEALFAFLAFSGFSAKSLYTIYFCKNKINQFRIKSKY